MSSDPLSSHSPPSVPPEPNTLQDGPTGFARLARQISRRTTDFLAICIVAAGVLAVGGRVSQWWSTDPGESTSAVQRAEPVAGSAAVWGNSMSFDFGMRPYTLLKQFVLGNRQRASLLLVETCRQLTQTAEAPAKELDAAERELLAQTQLHQPLVQQAGTWKLYRFDQPLTLVLGTRRFAVPGAADVTKSGPAPGWRVVCWGMAFPQGENRWTLFMFHSSRQRGGWGIATPQSNASSGASRTQRRPPADVVLPPNSRRILSLRAETGEALIGFEGDGPPEDWTRFFDGHFRSNGWRVVRRWRSSETGWTARFGTAQGRWADIQLSRSSRDRVGSLRSKWTGLVSVMAPPGDSKRRGRP